MSRDVNEFFVTHDSEHPADVAERLAASEEAAGRHERARLLRAASVGLRRVSERMRHATPDEQLRMAGEFARRIPGSRIVTWHSRRLRVVRRAAPRRVVSGRRVARPLRRRRVRAPARPSRDDDPDASPVHPTKRPTEAPPTHAASPLSDRLAVLVSAASAALRDCIPLAGAA
jgi:hypothetical protein